MRARITRVAQTLREEGHGFQSIGREIGIPHETVRRFCSADDEDRALSDRAAFRPVDVSMAAASGLVLTTSNGHRVEGATTTEIVAMLRGLR